MLCAASKNLKVAVARCEEVLNQLFAPHTHGPLIRAMYAKLDAGPGSDPNPEPVRASEYKVKKMLRALAGEAKLGGHEAVAFLLSGMKTELLDASLPEAYKKKKRVQATQEAMDAVNEAWSEARCMNIKTRNLLSRRKWERLRKALSFTWDSVSGMFKQMTIGDTEVLFPALMTQKKLRSFQSALERKYGMTVGFEGLEVHVDLKTSIARDLAYSLEHGLLVLENGIVTDPGDGDCVEIQFKMDAANIHKGMKQTSIAYSLVHGSANPNSPHETHEFCVFEGDDHWDAVRKFGAASLNEINSLLDNPIIEWQGVDGNTVRAKLVRAGGGDLSNVGSLNCISGCGGPFPCMLCEQPGEDMCETDLKKLGKVEKRTRDRIALLSHSRVSGPDEKCPGCGMIIVEKVTDHTKQMPIARAGDEPPKKSSWTGLLASKKKFSWLNLHKGVVYGQHCLLNIPLTDWVICLLHMNLRIVNGLFVQLIVNKIGGTKAVKQKQTADLIHLITETAGMYMKESKLQPKKKSVEADWVKVSFAGADAGKLMHKDIFDTALEIIHPKEVREGHNGRQVQRQWEKSMAVVAQWRVVWALLNQDLGPSQSDRDLRAEKIQSAGVKFVNLWCSAHERSKGLYLHLLVAHVPGMVRRFGDLRLYQVQGLEHCHSIRKQVARLVTNRKKGQRAAQTMSYMVCQDYVSKEGRQHMEAREHAILVKARAARALRRIKKGKHTMGGSKIAESEERVDNPDS